MKYEENRLFDLSCMRRLQDRFEIFKDLSVYVMFRDDQEFSPLSVMKEIKLHLIGFVGFTKIVEYY